MNKITALSTLLQCEIKEIEQTEYDKNIFKVENTEYIVLTKKEKYNKAATCIIETLWAFDTDFILSHTKLPYEAYEMIHKYQELKCESANNMIYKLIDNIQQFIKDAIQACGIEHFLDTYDYKEYRIAGYSIYRVS